MKNFDWFLNYNAATMMEIPYFNSKKYGIFDFESNGYLIVYKCRNKYTNDVTYVYNENKIIEDTEVSMYVFKTATDLVEFLCHKNSMTKEKELQLKGIPNIAIHDILKDETDVIYDFEGLEIPVNSKHLDILKKELNRLYA